MLLKGQLIREDHMKCFTLLRKQKTENRVAVIVKDFVIMRGVTNKAILRNAFIQLP